MCRRFPSLFVFLALAMGTAAAWGAVPAKPPAGDPATFEIAVNPASIAPGGAAKVSLRLAPAAGIKINRYPKIKLAIAEQPGLVGAAEGAAGSDAPPPPEKMDANYFKTIDPVTLELPVSTGATPGRHEIPARLTYFYCVAASGYCAPARVPVKIPVTIR